MLTDILAINKQLTKSEEMNQKEMIRLAKQIKIKLDTNAAPSSTQNLQYAIESNLTATIGA